MIFINDGTYYDCEFELFDWDDEMPLFTLLTATDEDTGVIYSREACVFKGLPIEQWETDYGDDGEVISDALEGLAGDRIDEAYETLRESQWT